MTDAYIIVEVNENLVAEARTALHKGGWVAERADIVFYEDGRQAAYVGPDITQHQATYDFAAVGGMFRKYMNSVKREAAKRKEKK